MSSVPFSQMLPCFEEVLTGVAVAQLLRNPPAQYHKRAGLLGHSLKILLEGSHEELRLTVCSPMKRQTAMDTLKISRNNDLIKMLGFSLGHF